MFSLHLGGPVHMITVRLLTALGSIHTETV